MKRWNELARSSIEQAGCIIVLLVFVIIFHNKVTDLLNILSQNYSHAMLRR